MSELIDQISQNKSELLKAEFSFFNDSLSSIVIISFIIFLIILKLLVFLWLGIYPAQVTEESWEYKICVFFIFWEYQGSSFDWILNAMMANNGSHWRTDSPIQPRRLYFLKQSNVTICSCTSCKASWRKYYWHLFGSQVSPMSEQWKRKPQLSMNFSSIWKQNLQEWCTITDPSLSLQSWKWKRIEIYTFFANMK